MTEHPKITFRYYSSSNESRPAMSDTLYGLIQDCVEKLGASSCSIVHLGTVGDPRTHRPGTSHMRKPPEAIDVRSITLKWADGREKTLDLRKNLGLRALVREIWEEFGGKTAHAHDPRHGHIHLQTPKEWW